METLDRCFELLALISIANVSYMSKFYQNANSIMLYYFCLPIFPPVGVRIGIHSPVFTTEEGSNVTVCAQLMGGELERDVVVTLSTQDGSATSGGEICTCMYQNLMCSILIQLCAYCKVSINAFYPY